MANIKSTAIHRDTALVRQAVAGAADLEWFDVLACTVRQQRIRASSLEEAQAIAAKTFPAASSVTVTHGQSRDTGHGESRHG